MNGDLLEKGKHPGSEKKEQVMSWWDVRRVEQRPVHALEPSIRVAKALGKISLGALALGAAATGAIAVGAMAIGKLSIKRGKIARLDIEELTVGRLRVRELVIEQEQTLGDDRPNGSRSEAAT